VRVLIVDDNARSRRILEEMLQRRGMLGVSAADSSQAIAAIAEANASGTPFGLALVDSSVPGLDSLGLGS